MGGVVIFDQPVSVPEGTRVEVVVKANPSAASPLAATLLKQAGTVHDLPADLAEHHDHYLHAAPKR